MTKFTVLTLALLAGVSLNALRAEAQTEMPTGEQPQTRVPDEANRPAIADIDADGDGDGAVTGEELRAFGTTRGRARFAEIDADGDGLASRDEFLARAASRAPARVDRTIARLDGDGLLTAGEAAARPAAPRAGRSEARADDPRSRGRRAGIHDRGPRDLGGDDHGGRHGDRRSDARGDDPRGRRGAAGDPAEFERADTDGNGSLDVGEWSAAGLRGRT